MDKKELAGFLRRRRELLQPADVGVPEGARRRTPGLRRYEVAQLAGMSPDYYIRLEQARGPQPSPQMLTALARALRLGIDERDHLFHLAGHHAPPAFAADDHVSPGLLRLLDALTELPAQVVSDLGEILVQNRMAVALLGEQTAHTGLARSFTYRWFTQPATRALYPREDHERQSQVQVADLRAAVALRPRDPQAAKLVSALRAASREFDDLWERHDVAVRRSDRKRIVHPTVGIVCIDCEVLATARRDQRLLVFAPRPGSDAAGQLELLRVIGHQNLTAPDPLPDRLI
ncbi:helix-turn-helix transcriptional regulator [Actinacidiphila oryziradicis]|uniref:Helix-turn-helix transcriptional regulator n=1 Tax=Actinacidiphila oryziradicis TaxID=2571141 RepID=A0A4U0SCR5_9ACTN|nr:helix-turn-helix transcriptional regulator [Actinacidiphila oryziradicis]TKA06398.1 helix-turn-helix transcriptional regulator [Actinacidiphila oryziradicis]